MTRPRVHHVACLVLGIGLALWAQSGAPDVAAAGHPTWPQTPPAAAAPPPAEQVPTVFTTGTELATIEVGVVDQGGRPVRGLTAADFTLEVDGQPRTVQAAEFVRQDATVGPPPSEQFTTNEGADGGRLLMLVVDQGNVRPGIGSVLGRAADRLLGDLGPGDRVALASLPLGQLVGFTSHIALVRERLSRITGVSAGAVSRTGRPGSMTISDAMAIARGDRRVLDEVSSRECGQIPNSQLREDCVGGYAGEAQSMAFQVRDQTQGTLIALRRLLGQLEQVPGRKTLVLLSEGLVLEDRADEVSWVRGLVARARVNLYAVQLHGEHLESEIPMGRTAGSSASDRRLRASGLQTLVAMAGGVLFLSAAGPEIAFSRISAELTGYYRLAFAPVGAERDGKDRSLAVGVRRPGVEVRAPRVYSIGGPGAAAATDEDRLVEVLRSPLLETGLRLRVATYSAPDASPGSVRVLVAVGLGRGDEELPVRMVAFMVVDRDGAVVMSRAAPPERRASGDHRYQVALQLEPGPYTLKVAAVDAAGRRGSVDHRFVAKLGSAGPVSIGDLALLDVAAAQTGELRPGIEPLVREERTFAYLELGSADAGRLAAASARVEIAREPNAEPLGTFDLTLRPAGSPSRRVAQGVLALESLPPGDYTARAIVLVDGKPLGRALRPFRYDPTSEVRARRLTRGLGPLGGSPGGFDRAVVLSPPIASFFLGQASRALPPGDALTASALELATQGRYTDLPEVLAAATPRGPVVPFLRGLGLLARGELDPAAEQFREALRFSSEFAAATFYLGACYAAGGRDGEAVGAWQTTMAADTVAPFIHGLTGEAYLRLGDSDGAVAAASEGLALTPDDDTLRMLLVRAQARAGRPADALAALDPYLVRHPADAEAHFLAMRLLYDAALAGRLTAARHDDRARFDRYLAGYAAAGGQQLALAGEWRAVLEGPPRR